MYVTTIHHINYNHKFYLKETKMHLQRDKMLLTENVAINVNGLLCFCLCF